jgi:tetratricopeptide (TPR) repeat protein
MEVCLRAGIFRNGEPAHNSTYGSLPLVDPSASFDVAARHLFRHLGDAAQLSRNPLVRRFFQSDEFEQFAPAKERAALSLIRELVVRAAERHWGSAREQSGGREAAYRRYTIVIEHTLVGRPLAEVAAQLGVSMRQCYRERGDAIRRIAEYIRSYEVSPRVDIVSDIDAFQLRMDRAASRAAVGDLELALRDYDEIVKADPSAEHKLEALCRRAEALVEHGDFEAAEAAIVCARDLGRTAPGLPALARIHLIAARAFWLTGRFEQDSRELDGALDSIEPLLPEADDRVKELHAEILLEFCERYRTRGEFARAHERLLGVEAALRSVRMPTPKRAFDAMMESWSLGAKDVQFEGAGTRSLSRYEGLLELRALARSFTSPKRLIRLAEAFMQHHADAGDHVTASQWAQRAIRIAREHADGRLLAEVHLVLADWMSITPQSDRAPRLLQGAEGVFPAGSPDWILFRGLQAECALQAQRYEEAIALATDVESAVERMGNPRFGAAARTTIALAAHALGKQKEAQEQMSSALEVIDAYGTPWTRLSAYRAAATITGERRHRRRMREIRRSLQA